MAASNTPVGKELQPGGKLVEFGTWTSSGGTATLTITADTTTINGVSNDIVEIEEFWFSSDGDTAVLPAQDVGANKIKITFTANDTGKYRIKGRTA